MIPEKHTRLITSGQRVNDHSKKSVSWVPIVRSLFSGVVVMNRGHWLTSDDDFVAVSIVYAAPLQLTVDSFMLCVLPFRIDCCQSQGWEAALRTATHASPTSLIIARNTPPGAPNCTLAMGPVQKPPSLAYLQNWTYEDNDIDRGIFAMPMWLQVDRQNALLSNLVRTKFPTSVLLLDVRTSTRLRPDCHRSSMVSRQIKKRGRTFTSPVPCVTVV
jgi:hypothetical protein